MCNDKEEVNERLQTYKRSTDYYARGKNLLLS